MSLAASSSLADVSDLAGVCAELPWLADALAPLGDLASVRVESMSGAGGLNAEMSRLCVTFKNSRYIVFCFASLSHPSRDCPWRPSKFSRHSAAAKVSF
jgi:hypothetical protein